MRVDEREWAGAAAAIDGAVRRVRTDNCGASFASFEASYYKRNRGDRAFSSRTSYLLKKFEDSAKRSSVLRH